MKEFYSSNLSINNHNYVLSISSVLLSLCISQTLTPRWHFVASRPVHATQNSTSSASLGATTAPSYPKTGVGIRKYILSMCAFRGGCESFPLYCVAPGNPKRQTPQIRIPQGTYQHPVRCPIEMPLAKSITYFLSANLARFCSVRFKSSMESIPMPTSF